MTPQQLASRQRAMLAGLIKTKRPVPAKVVDRFLRYRVSAKVWNRTWSLSDAQAGDLLDSPCTFCHKKAGLIFLKHPETGYVYENCVPVCRACQKMQQQKRTRKHGGYYKRPTNRARGYPHDARRRGLCWDLSTARVLELFKSPCHYCGGDGYGLDRYDNALGYTVANVVPCCSTCNFMKRALSAPEFFVHIHKIHAHKLLTSTDDVLA